ncbi:MAG: hypothetical protein A4E32_01187 [Methanomassiliicoccales archaeon PtaU1.Bin124]|nr:MAG: hypothetical protein A4E32_01187 [Methanomassiliicoccales archaeon PtaU1.Bin124]
MDTIWWRSYSNPTFFESIIYYNLLNKLPDFKTYQQKSKKFLKIFIPYINFKWKNKIWEIVNQEKDINLVFFINIPLDQITDIPSKIKEEFGIPSFYLEGDMPTILPKYSVGRGFKFNYYQNADLSVFDIFYSNSIGVTNDIKSMGAKKIESLHYAVDPQFFQPLPTRKKFDISFFGYGSQYREDWMEKLITKPSNEMCRYKFAVAGGGFGISLGNADLVGDISFDNYRLFCSQSRINLNITRWSHTNVYGSSTARIFELAGFGCCIVSQPYNGMDEWFDPGREIFMIKNDEEINELYNWLLDDEEIRIKSGMAARERVLKNHTYGHRAQQIINNFNDLKDKT